jgi:hypothetical protein
MGVGAVGGVIGLAGSGISAMGKMQEAEIEAKNTQMRGVTEGMQAWWQAGSLNIAAAMDDLRATETDTYLRQKTMEQMSNIRDVMAITGSEMDSPSNAAVRNRFEGLSDSAREMRMWNSKMEAEQKRNTAQLVLMSGMLNMMTAQDNAGKIRSGGRMAAIGSMLGGLGGLFG